MWTNVDGHLTVYHFFVNANLIINMKSTIIATLGLLAAALPASAGVLLPNLYAQEYCAMRESGVSNSGALEWATSQSYISSGTAITVTMQDGTQMDGDVIAAANAAANLCPEYYYAD